MSRTSAATDASRWPATVCAWVDREQRRRKKRAAQEPKPSEPFERSTKRVPHTKLTRSRYFTRFLFDLDAIVLRARRGDVRAAWQIAAMYREAHRTGADCDPTVAKFLRRIRGYMESARKRYAADCRLRIGRALGIETTKRGRRARAAGGRNVTDDMLDEARKIYVAKWNEGASEKDAVSAAAQQTGIGSRAIRAAVARRKKERRSRAPQGQSSARIKQQPTQAA